MPVNTGQYKYSDYRPPAHRFRQGEDERHKVAYRIRTNRLVPVGTNGRVSYLTKCTCGWKDPRGEYLPMRSVLRRWDAHMANVQRQSRLNLDR